MYSEYTPSPTYPLINLYVSFVDEVFDRALCSEMRSSTLDHCKVVQKTVSKILVVLWMSSNSVDGVSVLLSTSFLSLALLAKQ